MSLKDLIIKDVKNKNSPIIKLMNKNHEPVGALYLDKLKADLEDLVICESTSVNEKYYLFVNGISIFFTYYEKIETK